MSLKSTLKGMFGEALINMTTWLMLDKAVYHRINNVTLPLPNGGSTQIDHVIVSKFGIFVIETKNYKGWIFGHENQAQWTQVLHNQKYRFQNPLRQNYLHIKTLVNLLDLDEAKCHSIIAFIGDCELKTRDTLPNNVLSSGIIAYIKDKQAELLTLEQVKHIVESIQTQRFAKSWRTNAKHKAYVKAKHGAKPQAQTGTTTVKATTSIASVKTSAKTSLTTAAAATTPSATTATTATPAAATPICPKCASNMVKRVAKTGNRQGQTFWGCANYPKCRGVVAIPPLR